MNSKQPRKRSSSRPPVMQRLRHSWTRWCQTRREKRAARLAARLAPVLQQALSPVAGMLVAQAERLDNLEGSQLLLSQQQQALHRLLESSQPEISSLLLELLSSLQPTAEQQISQRLGLPTPQTSHHASAS